MSVKRQLFFFFAAAVCLSVAGGIHETIFNNFLDDTFEVSAMDRGALELPREAPGFLVVVTTGLLAGLAVSRVAVSGALIMSAGMVGLAIFGGTYGLMIAMMVLFSTGMHLLMPVSSSIALSLADEDRRGRRMGQLGVARTVGLMLGAGLVWAFVDPAAPAYRWGFVGAGVAALGGAFFYFRLDLPDLKKRRQRLVFRRRYGLYYALEFLFGARKQIFVTFGLWVLVKVYNQPAAHIGMLWFVASAIGLGFKPLAGMAIDRFGERVVMVVDGLALAVVCLGYGYAEHFTPDMATASLVASGCFVVDNLLFALGTSRAIYVSRITPDREELTATLSMGVSINHISSMTIPLAAGAIWVTLGYERVFVCAAMLALGIAATSGLVPSRSRRLEAAAAQATP